MTQEVDDTNADQTPEPPQDGPQPVADVDPAVGDVGETGEPDAADPSQTRGEPPADGETTAPAGGPSEEDGE